MNGQELAEQAKSLNAELPIVLITGFATTFQSKQWQRLGLDGFLTKPFRIDELLDTVAAVAPDVSRRGSGRSFARS
jgi:FixJ family two-component response regulator